MTLLASRLLATAALAALVSLPALAEEKAAKEAAPTAPAAAEAPAEPTAAMQELLKVGKEDHVLGKETAPVTIVEYASMSCPHCADFYNNVFPKLKEQFIDTGKARFVFRQFPLNVTALKGGALAECAGSERYHDYLKVLFAQQEKWAYSQDYAAPLGTIASVGGMSREDFDKCMNDPLVEGKLVSSRKMASDVLGVESTPTFFVNGKKVVGEKGVKDFQALIELAIKESGKGAR